MQRHATSLSIWGKKVERFIYGEKRVKYLPMGKKRFKSRQMARGDGDVDPLPEPVPRCSFGIRGKRWNAGNGM